MQLLSAGGGYATDAAARMWQDWVRHQYQQGMQTPMPQYGQPIR